MNGEMFPPLTDLELVGPISPATLSGLHQVCRIADGRTLVARAVRSSSAEELESVKQELHRLQNLDHSKLDRPVVLDGGSDGDELLLVSDIWPGELLFERINRGRLAIEEALQITIAVASGLAALHRAGSFHGRMNPGEVWLGSGNQVTILGLGLRHLRSRVSEELESEIMQAAQLAYLSPELLTGAELGPASDVWGVGLLLYEMVNGRRAFPGSDKAAVRAAVLHDNPKSITGVRTGIGEELAVFFARTLDKNPASRFASMEVAHDCLVAALELLTPRTENFDRSTPGGPAPPDTAVSVPLIVGQRVGNFEILERLGSGGMGRVFRARDRRLGRSVALKFLPARAHVKAQEQLFIQEAKAASALDHPNICTIYGVDEAPGGETFIVMAHYDGPSLSRRLDAGPLGVKEAVTIGEQVASGLAAAHERGIVHCDIKPANIMLTGAGVAKIVDFGIAKIGAGISTSASGLQGTKGYLSPEQVEGKKYDHRVDIWALGIALYEMVAGERPFPGKDLKPLVAIMERDQTPLAELVRDIPERFEEIVSRCLEKDPDARYQSAAEVQDDLRSLRLGELSGDQARQVRERDRILVWTAAATAIVVAVSLWFAAGRGALLDRRTGLAVIGFQARSDHGRAPWLASSLQELLDFELGAYPDLRLVQPSDQELGTVLEGQQPWLDGKDSALALVASSFDTHHAAAGTFSLVPGDTGDELEIALNIQPRAAWRDHRVVTVRGPPAQLIELVAQLSAQLAEVIDLDELPLVEASSDSWPHFVGTEQADLYNRALERMRWLDSPGAQRVLEKVVELEPGDPASRILLADALLDQGRDGAAREQLEAAALGAAALPRASRIMIRARHLAALRERSRVAALYTALWQVGKGPRLRGEEAADAAVRMSIALVQAGRAEEALSVLDSVDADDARFDLVRCEALHWLNRYTQMLEAAAQAVRTTGQLGAPLLQARARRLQATSHWRTGELDEGLIAAAAAAELYARENHPKGQADAAVTTGILFFEKGDLWQAKASYDSAAAHYRSLGNRRAEARTLTNKALVLEQLGDLDANIDVTMRALLLFRESGDPVAELITLVNLTGPLVARGRFEQAREAFDAALVLVGEVGRFEAWARYRYSDFMIVTGDLSSATSNLQHSLQIQERTDDRLGQAESTWRLGVVLLLQGEVAQACSAFEAAVPILEQRGSAVSLASALRGHARALLARGQAAEAEKTMDRVLELQEAAATQAGHAAALLDMARLSLAVGELAPAEAQARAALADFELRKMVLDQASAHELLARILYEGGSKRAAVDEIQLAKEIMGDLECPYQRLRIAITEHRISLERSPGDAHEALLDLLPEATSLGLVGLELELRFALAQAEMATGHQQAGRSRLDGVIAEARIKGLGELAQRAQQWMETSVTVPSR